MLKPQSRDPQNTRALLDLMFHISRELATEYELRTVLQRVIFLSMQSVGAISGSIIVVDDQGRPIESAIITGETVHDHTTQRLRSTLEHGLAGWVVRNRTAALVTDTSQDERWMLRQFERDEKALPKSAVSAPLMVRERLTGVMTLVHPKAGFFTSDHLELVQAIADQSSIAVLNTRLYAESQRQARVMTALVESAATITGSLNLEDVLMRIMEQISQALSVEAVSLALIDPQTQELVVRAATGPEQRKIINTRFKIGQGIAGWVARQGSGVVVDDASSDSRFDPELDKNTGFATRAIACAPLRYRGQVIGVLEAINPKNRAFNQDALLVLTGIGSLAGTAVRNAQLFENLQAAHQSYRELFEDSIDPIFISDRQGKVIEANRQAVQAAEFDKETLRKMVITQLHTSDIELLGSSFEKVTSGTPLSYESRLRSRSGHEIPIQVYVRQVKVEDVPHIQWILRDITERKNLDTMRDDLISMIYHDLRSPLANVVSSLDVLDNMLQEEDPTLRSLLSIALRSTDRIQRLTNSLLDINRLEAGQQIGSRQPADPLELIDEAFGIILSVTQNKEQSLEKDLPAALPLVLIDGDMIRRVLVNLMENAAKYSPPGSKITVGARQEANWVEIWVQDNGPGIPTTELERIFEKFTRLNNREKAKGLGLGLAYCQLAIQAHGGRIWAESIPGSGARFVFTLPSVKMDQPSD